MDPERDRPPDLPVAILTSSREVSDIRRARELGATCYLVKPMGFSLLVEIVRGIDAWIRTGTLPGSGWPDIAA
jgi:DNA-binding response OmpR family regulator